jgi:SpoVK/Ycf46/Vps4 family AAA+-type ATPase
MVYDEWELRRLVPHGQGVTALFAGPSGTGKTMAAEIVAGRLGLDLYRVDLSAVVSRYIGETEKNLRRLFDAAESGAAVLLFDEADALFGKRTEVKDAHDRYANVEVNYLLQRMEQYAGIAVLTTNRKGDLDEAFLRRLRVVLTFPLPDLARRRRIWERMLANDAPRGALDLDVLARLEITGGSIRNIVLAAAFLAAETGDPLSMTHLMGAARREYGKLDRGVTPSEFGAWSAVAS